MAPAPGGSALSAGVKTVVLISRPPVFLAPAVVGLNAKLLELQDLLVKDSEEFKAAMLQAPLMPPQTVDEPCVLQQKVLEQRSELHETQQRLAQKESECRELHQRLIARDEECYDLQQRILNLKRKHFKQQDSLKQQISDLMDELAMPSQETPCEPEAPSEGGEAGSSGPSLGSPQQTPCKSEAPAEGG